ncbi:hypothetical protein GGR58DRAFT_520809 [Xylaria digitata]|nr:hypothetical protein GGR58DRAFT_520809 [Xylaria digitata]
MLTAAMVSMRSFFYLIGNTPAVCLTQSMPPNVPAAGLLLGCGDVRHILFTRHMDGRQMDFTCCDNQKGVIARNMLLLSLITDDENNENRDLLWDIYYHMSIDQKALDLIRTQAKKLYDLSATMQTWQQSKYGSRISFCDSITLFIVRKVWSFYAANTSESLMESHMENALKRAKHLIGNSDSEKRATGISFRSAGPAQHLLADDMNTLHRNYWKYGKIEPNADASTAADHHNPTFLVGDDTVDIHYGANPLLGFHLASVYGPLSSNEPLSAKLKDLSQIEKIVATARDEFYQWMASYREHLSYTKVRFFNGDAVAFAHTLRHKRVTTLNTAHWYRDRSGLQPLILDGPDYALNTAPLEFNIIDTSNLCDHMGALTLLTATSFLLRHESSSVLFTEVLAKHHDTYEEVLDNLLCGNVPTLTTLLGLSPVDYWTNTSSVSVGDEILLHKSAEDTGKRIGQMFLRTSWKRPVSMTPSLGSCSQSPCIRFDAAQLSRLLDRVYAQMFDEDLSNVFSSMSITRARKASLVWYNRASFASFLRLVKTRVICDWDEAIRSLLERIITRPNVPMATNYGQELVTYFHILGIYSTKLFQNWHSRRQDPALSSSPMPPAGGKWRDLRDWENMPPVVCVTLRIPRNKLEVITNVDSMKLATPVVYCVVQSVGSNKTSARNVFYACQLAFGNISTRGERSSDSFEVLVEEDEAGWVGSSPLIAVFYVPALCLLVQPRETTVAFAIRNTPATSPIFTEKLGPEMKVYQTVLADSAAVYVTRHAPHTTRYPVVIGAAPATPAGPVIMGAVSSLTAGVDQETGSIVTFTTRVDVSYDNRKQALRNQCQVQTSAASPFEIAIQLGQTTPIIVPFPVYISKDHRNLRVARRSSWVEVTVQVADCTDWMKYAQYMYPVHLQDGKPINLNMPYLQLAKCPVIDKGQKDKLVWYTDHVSMELSARERVLRDFKKLPRTPGESLRIDLKETLLCLFVQPIDPGSPISTVYGIHDAVQNLPKIMILVHSLRMNPSDRSVVLDCAVIPLYPPNSVEIRNFLFKYIVGTKNNTISANDEEIELWRQVLPAYVERCRTWAHRADCEYARAGKVPLTTEDSKQFLCSCGNGQFPPDYKIDAPDWDKVKKYAVRAAISPAFWAPFVDSVYLEPDGKGCPVCGHTTRADGGPLLSCSGCMKTKYCSRNCQVAHWRMHKAVCNKK